MKTAAEVLKKIVSVIVSAILIICVAALAIVITARIKGETPSFFGYSFYIVLTDSMTPEINVDDAVIIKKVDNSEISIGDDIVFVSADPDLNHMTIVHRVVRINEDGSFVTQGVKQGASEDNYPVSEPLGKVVAVMGWLGNFLAFMTNNPAIIFLIIAVLFLLLASTEIKNIITELKKKKTAEIESLKQKAKKDAEELYKEDNGKDIENCQQDKKTSCQNDDKSEKK